MNLRGLRIYAAAVGPVAARPHFSVSRVWVALTSRCSHQAAGGALYLYTITTCMKITCVFLVLF